MSLQFNSSRTASLDGIWDFYPGDHKLADLDLVDSALIRVPGLWEAQGYLELDGTAWYRRRFTLDDVDGYWTLRFDAVMDLADVYLNGTLAGTHESPFTPFEITPRELLVEGENVLAVRVFDPSLDDADHLRSAHGKQGWANQVFPSRPSLYMTYGGIWQSVTLRRHGPVKVRDVFANADPEALVVRVELENCADTEIGARLGVRTLGVDHEIDIRVPARGRERVHAELGSTTAPRWSPETPVLHDVLVDVHAEGGLSDSRSARYGLRTVRVEGTRLLVNGEPYRMKSVLVQGFRAAELYGDGTREDIVDEVAKARDMGFNTLRLHIRAFSPTYLDVCDEMGMLLHCDLPVAEPIAHEEMDAGTPLARRAVAAIQEQVCRDRNHPSIILWSAMNEICDGQWEARHWPGYEQFARTLYAAVAENDPTRPIIENDWIEPDPDYVFLSPILTAHWYGRLHRDYLAKIDDAARRFTHVGRPLFVTEFGDWGLPEMPALPQPPFWDTRETYAAGLAGTQWPGTMARFVTETQRYQGLSDRLQAEVFRRHDHIGGYCLTELTDVPHELNGLLDLHRRPKPLAVDEMRRANQVVLPMFALDSLVVTAGQVISARVFVANDGRWLGDIEIQARFGDFVALRMNDVMAVDASHLSAEAAAARFDESIWALRLDRLEGYRAAEVGEMTIVAPDVPGSHDLVVQLATEGRFLSENRYPIHVVEEPNASIPVRVVGDNGTEAALAVVGAVASGEGPLVIGEGCLDAGSAPGVRQALDRGEVVIVLAQPPDAAGHFPVPVVLEPVITAWGSSVFQFTTDAGGIPSLPRRNVLVAEDSTIQATSAVARIDGQPFPDAAVVIAYKPVPGAVTGTVLGSHGVAAGRLLFCQYRLCAGASKGDAAARAVLADLLRWGGQRRSTMRVERVLMPDRRNQAIYSWSEEAGT